MKYVLLLSLPLYALDQLTKLAILRRFPDPESGAPPEQITVIPGFFNVVRVHNKGMAFGRFSSLQNANLVFGAIAVGALVLIAVLWRRNAFPNRTSRFAAALLVAGILGNFTDRILHGYVVDFLDFILPWYGHWPSFNVADSCICVAAGLLFLGAFLKHEHPAAAAGPSRDNPAPAPDND